MKRLKQIIKKVVGKNLTFKIGFSKRIYHKFYRKNKSIKGFVKSFLLTRFYKKKTAGDSLVKLLSKIKLADVLQNDNFYYSLDIYIYHFRFPFLARLQENIRLFFGRF